MTTSFDQPALLLTYAPSGYGKTTDLVLSFPRFLFICQPGGLLPAETVAGYRPNQIRTAKTFDHLIQIVEQEKKKQEKAKDRIWDGICVDDWSLMSDTSLAEFEQDYPIAQNGKKDTNAFWAKVRRKLLEVRDTLRYSDLHMICNAHERGPHNDERKGYIPGGPALPGTMPADMPKTFDAVLRVVPGDGIPVWPFAYRADENDTSWVTKNRFNIYGDFPMNLGEMLRLFYGVEGKWAIRRHESMPWQEEMVEKISQKLAPYPLNSEEHVVMRQRLMDSMRKRLPEATNRQLVWTLRDGMHRAVLRDLRERAILSRYGVV
jgi:AAA domain